MTVIDTRRIAGLLILGAFAFAACQKAVEYNKFESDGDVPRITVADAKKDFDAGKAVFVDSRAEPAFRSERIAGAINVPFSANADLEKVPKGKKLIIYCS